MTAVISIHPQHVLTPGRYLLDHEGRLHPDRYSGFIRAVAAVTVRCKPAPVIIKANGSGQTAEALVAAKCPHPSRGDLRRGPKAVVKPGSSKHSVSTPKPKATRSPAAPVTKPTLPRTKTESFALFDKVSERIKQQPIGRARRVEKPVEPFDAARYAAARERERQDKAKKDAIKLPPMVRALSPEACAMCGASGRNGCDHYLPFEGN